MLTEAVLLAVLLLAGLAWWRRGYWARRGVLTLPGDPIFGNIRSVILFRTDIATYFDHIYKKYKEKKLIGLYNFWEPILLVTDVELIRKVLITDYNSFPLAVFYLNKTVDPLINLNPFVTYGEEWKVRRGMHIASFTQAKLKEYVPAIQKVGETMIRYIKGFEQKPLKVVDIAKFYTIDNIVSIAFGYEPTSFVDEEGGFRKYGKSLLDNNAAITGTIGTFIPFLCDLFRLRLISKEGQDFFREMARKIYDFRKKNKVVRHDLVDQLLKIEQRRISEGKKGFELDEVAGHMLTTYIDSTETSSTLISFLLLEVANRPEVQDRLREEMWAVSRDHRDFDLEKVSSLVYLNMVFNEILRLHPLLYYLSRLCVKDTKLGNVDIQKGTKVFIPYCSLINDPEYYPDPEKFDPERFSPAKMSSDVKNTFFPFGEGPKQCLGMKYAMLQIKMAVVFILLNFKLVPLKQSDGNKVENAKGSNLLQKPDDEEKLIFQSL